MGPVFLISDPVLVIVSRFFNLYPCFFSSSLSNSIAEKYNLEDEEEHTEESLKREPAEESK